jgi:hypothetical protein
MRLRVKDELLSDTQQLCPSAQPDWKRASAIGVIGGTANEPRVGYLANTLAVTDEILTLSDPVTPTEVFRFAAPCVRAGCVHFEDSACRLATRIVKLLPTVTERLPKCAVRSECRWWLQEGKAACLRCPQVVTDNYNPSDRMRQAADPASQI